MFIAFPVDEKTKARLEAVCNTFNISIEDWFMAALKASEFDVLINSINSSKEHITWMWDEEINRFVRRTDDD